MSTISKAISVLLVISLLCGAFAVITDTDSNADIYTDDDKCQILVIRLSGPDNTAKIREITYNSSTEEFSEDDYESENITAKGTSDEVQLEINSDTIQMYALAFDENIKNASVILGKNTEVYIVDTPAGYGACLEGLIIGDCKVSEDKKSVTYSQGFIRSLKFLYSDNPEGTLLQINDFAEIKSGDVDTAKCSLYFDGIKTISLATGKNKDASLPSTQYYAYWYLNSISFKGIEKLDIITASTADNSGSYGLRAVSSVKFESIGEITFEHSGANSGNTTYGICVSDNPESPSDGEILFSECESVIMNVEGNTSSRVFGMMLNKGSYCDNSIEIDGVNSFNLAVGGGEDVYGIAIGGEDYIYSEGVIKIVDSNLHLTSFMTTDTFHCLNAMLLSSEGGNKGKIVTDENISGDNITYADNNEEIMDEFKTGKTCAIESSSWLLISNQSPGPEPTPIPTEEVTKDLTTLAIMIGILVVVVVLSLLAVMMARRR